MDDSKDVPALSTDTQSNGVIRPRKSISSRPNYNAIHAALLPLNTHPLPAFHPTNPLSLLWIAYSFFRTAFSHPSSHPSVLYKGLLHSETASIHITDPTTIRVFWEKGFFGKGSLSRSEPTWLEREQRRLDLIEGETSEELTARRRAERRALKKERARAQIVERENRLKGVPEGRPKIDEETAHSNGSIPDANGSVDKETTAAEKSIPATVEEPEHDDDHISNTHQPNGIISKDFEPDANGATGIKAVRFDLGLTTVISGGPLEILPPIPATSLEDENTENEKLAALAAVKNEEHLQLTLEEAFFLVFGLGVLDVFDLETQVRVI